MVSGPTLLPAQSPLPFQSQTVHWVNNSLMNKKISHEFISQFKFFLSFPILSGLLLHQVFCSLACFQLVKKDGWRMANSAIKNLQNTQIGREQSQIVRKMAPILWRLTLKRKTNSYSSTSYPKKGGISMRLRGLDLVTGVRIESLSGLMAQSQYIRTGELSNPHHWAIPTTRTVAWLLTGCSGFMGQGTRVLGFIQTAIGDWNIFAKNHRGEKLKQNC